MWKCANILTLVVVVVLIVNSPLYPMGSDVTSTLYVLVRTTFFFLRSGKIPRIIGRKNKYQAMVSLSRLGTPTSFFGTMCRPVVNLRPPECKADALTTCPTETVNESQNSLYPLGSFAPSCRWRKYQGEFNFGETLGNLTLPFTDI